MKEADANRIGFLYLYYSVKTQPTKVSSMQYWSNTSPQRKQEFRFPCLRCGLVLSVVSV